MLSTHTSAGPVSLLAQGISPKVGISSVVLPRLAKRQTAIHLHS